MEKTLLILSMISVIGLTACSHENPLESPDKIETAKFLKAASMYAEKKMKYKTSKDGHGIIYGACMLGRTGGALASPDFCPKFYSEMVEYAKQSSSSFDEITVADLSSQKAFENIKNVYIYGSENSKF